MSIGVVGRQRSLTYPCPRCGVDLEVTAEAVPGWYRCPGCGRAAQPPEPVLNRRRAPENEILVIGERGDVTSLRVDPDVPADPAMPPSADPFHDIQRALDPTTAVAPPRPIFRPAMPSPSAPAPAGVPTLRVVLGVLFFLATVFFVFSALAQDGVSAAIFGLGAVVLLMLLARPSRRRL